MSTSLRRQAPSRPSPPSPAASSSANAARKPSGSAHHRTVAPALPPPRTFSADSERSSAAWSTTSTVGDARETRPHVHCSLALTGRCVCTSGDGAQEAEDRKNVQERLSLDTGEIDQAIPAHSERVFHYYTLPNGAYREPKTPSQPAPEPAGGNPPSRSPSVSRRAQTPQQKHKNNDSPAPQTPQATSRRPSITRKKPVPLAPAPGPSNHGGPSPSHSLRRQKEYSSLRRQGSTGHAESPQRPPRATPPAQQRVGDSGPAPSPTTRKMKHTSAPLPVLAAGRDAAPVQRSNTVPHQHRAAAAADAPGPRRVFNYYTLPNGEYRTPRAAPSAPSGVQPDTPLNERPAYYITHEPSVRGRGRGHTRSSSTPHTGPGRPTLTIPVPAPDVAHVRAGDDDDDDDGDAGTGGSDDSARARRIPKPSDRSPYPERRSLPVTPSEAPTGPVPADTDGDGGGARGESWVPPPVLPRGSGETPPGILLNRMPVAPHVVDFGFVPPVRGRWRSRSLPRRRPSGTAAAADDGSVPPKDARASGGKRAWVRAVSRVRAVLSKA